MAPERPLLSPKSAPVVRKPYAKAERSSKACDKCHARKTRCSGSCPCTFCSTRGFACTFSDNSASMKSSGESRISPPAAAASFNSRESPSLNLLAEALNRPPPMHNPTTTIQPAHLVSPESQMGSTSDQNSELSPESRMRDEEYSVSGLVLTRIQRAPTKPCCEPDIPGLIDRRSSTKFFDAYFNEGEWIYQLYPEQEHIMSMQHEALWGDTDVHLPTGSKTVLAALLALGALFERQYAESEKLYLAARQSYLDVTDLLTLTSVQLTMQMVVFEINSSRSASLWSTLATAVRLAQALNLHREPALANRSREERLQRQQLWWCCVVHDTWHSLTAGRPCLIDISDCDLERPWEPNFSYPGSRPLSFKIFAMRAKLSFIWSKIHATLYTRHERTQSDEYWLKVLPQLDEELQSWQADLNKILPPTNVTAQRSDAKQFQCVSLAQGVARIIFHRSFLIRPFLSRPSTAYTQQRLASERAVLDGAFQVLATTRKLLDLGVHLAFWFLVSNLQIACLAFCERARDLTATGSRDQELHSATEGFQKGLQLLQEIERSGDNALAGQVAHAVQVIQAAGGLPRPAAPQTSNDGSAETSKASHGARALGSTEPSTPSAIFQQVTPSLQSTTVGSSDVGWGSANPDLSWLASLCNTTDLGDAFIPGSPGAPAAGSIAWWCT